MLTAAIPTRYGGLKCVMCGAMPDMVTSLDTVSAPQDGDASLCFECGAWLIIDLSVVDHCRPPTPAEHFALQSDPFAQGVSLAWMMSRKASC